MEMTAILSQLANQGIGYTLFVLSCLVNYKLYKDRQVESSSRILDVKEMTDKFQSAIDKMNESHVIALEKANKVADATYLVVQNLQQNSNMRQQ
jgi:hypothetical protein